MSGFQTLAARLARAAETAAYEEEAKATAVAVPLSETAQSLPPHIIAATDPRKLNKQASIFRCPAWAGLPSRPYHLHCERSGVPFPALALHRFPYYLFGKNDVCDYVLEHPSVSSVHAALIFNKEHACFVLLDLGSTNGTRLQGKRVEARKPVPIAVGSSLQFGYSTRTYELRAGPATAVKRTREGEGEEAVESVKHDGKESETHTAAAAPTFTLLPSPSPSPSFSPAPSAPENFSASGAPPSALPVCGTATADAVQPPGSPPLAPQEVVETPGDSTVAETEAPQPASMHLYQLVVKHKDVDNPVSRGHNKGEVITRSKADALEMVRFIVAEHQGQVPVDTTLGFSPWTVEAFVAAVREYCEVSSKKKAGDLGMVEKGTFSDVIEEAAFRLCRGEVSAPVETQLGIHLLFRCD